MSLLTIRSIIYAIIFLLYFANSKRVQNTFPEKTRQTYSRDYIVTGVFLAVHVALLIFLISQVVASTPVDAPANPVIRQLHENEYGDGRFYFIKPSEFTINKTYYDFEPVFTMDHPDGLIGISAIGGVFDGKDHQSYFDDNVKGFLDGLGDGALIDYDIISDNHGYVNDFEYYERAMTIHGETDLNVILRFIFDKDSKNAALIILYASPESFDAGKGYFMNVVNSVKFS